MAARYRERYRQTAKRLGKQRGKKIARVEVARRLAERSGTCSRPAGPSPRRVAQSFWPPDGPAWELGRASEAPTNLIRPQPAMER